MTKSVQVFVATILFAMASAPIHAGWAGSVTQDVAVPKNRAIQNPVKIIRPSAPTITISSPPNQGASTTETSADFTITTNKPATICWKLDNGAQTCSAQGVTSFKAILYNLPPGSHTLEATASDATSNAITSARNWRVVIE